MSILLLFLISINGLFPIPAFGEKPAPNTMRFELIHRHAAEIEGRAFGPEKTQLERVQELVENDNVRVQMISQRLGERRKALGIQGASSAAIRISSGAYAGTGQYFVPFLVGTPPQKLLLIASTGSDLTWINCQYRCPNCRTAVGNRRHGFFNADKSSSFKTIPCSTKMCKESLPFSLVQCPKPMTPCAYDYGYSDQSSVKGFFANETVTLRLMNGLKMKLNQVPIGCSKSIDGGSFMGSDGVLGLGFSKYSFAMKAMDKFGGKFSYCLVDHLSPRNASNYLIFGKNENAGLASMRYTQLVAGLIETFYAVKVAGISVGGVMLNIPLSVWNVNRQGGAILDSSTSLTVLAEPAYQAVMTALKSPLMRYKRVKVPQFDFCFDTKGFNEASVPKLAFHFADRARFEPPVKSYVIKVNDAVRCLGFVPGPPDGLSIIGNIMQQNFVWEFDLNKQMLGYAPSTCT